MVLPRRLVGTHTEAEIDDAYRAVGRFITSMSDLDAVVTAVLGAFMQSGGVGQELVLHSIDFNRKREILRAILSDRSDTPPLLVELLKLLDAGDRLMSKRHVAAHGMLMSDKGQLILSSITIPAIMRHSKGKTEVLRVDSLDDLATKATEATGRIVEIAKLLEPKRAAP